MHGLRAAEQCFALPRRYTFPCETQALYTQDVSVVASAPFEESAFALHRIELPARASLAEHLRPQAQCDGVTCEAGLLFELFNCFEDGSEDEILAIGSLPMDAVLEAARSEQVCIGACACRLPMQRAHPSKTCPRSDHPVSADFAPCCLRFCRGERRRHAASQWTWHPRQRRQRVLLRALISIRTSLWM